jgi:hypothetical protein
VHNDVITHKKNHFPKHYIDDGAETIIDNEEEYYCHLTPLIVRIQSSKTTTYRLERVLYSILLALQHCDPSARLVIWDYEGDEDFSTLKQARRCSYFEPSKVKDFIEEPRTSARTYSFSGRICLLSEYTPTETKQDRKVCTWLSRERVYLSKNSLAISSGWFHHGTDIKKHARNTNCQNSKWDNKGTGIPGGVQVAKQLPEHKSQVFCYSYSPKRCVDIRKKF